MKRLFAFNSKKVKKSCALIAALCLAVSQLMAQDKPKFSRSHGIQAKSFTLKITPSVEGRTIHYTTDGSLPTMESRVYSSTSGIIVQKTTVVRAAEELGDGTLSAAATATYIILSSVVKQATNSAGDAIIPDGYPSTWGANIDIQGYAPAYYAMNRETVDESQDDIIAGFKQLPIISVVTDRDYLFSHEFDEERGGIYIYTGAPVGSQAGRGWERPISMEIMGGELKHDFTVDCGIKMHGGHSRLPEKNAKHAFTIVFKSKYGEKKLYYPAFGNGIEKFDDIILRTHHSNSWLHWDNSNRNRAQYTRDLWARSVQERLGWPHSKGQMVHLFLNGLYWGMYCMSEHIKADHCAVHYGGKEKNYDVIKVDELQGEAVVADEGTIDAWQSMTDLIEKVNGASNKEYYALEGLDINGKRDNTIEPLLDIDNFIDYMLINYYVGNSDWDVHNWTAFRNRDSGDKGFQFVCWDTELTFGGVNDNVTDKDNWGKPSHFLRCLMKNNKFKTRFSCRVKQLFTGNGILTPSKSVEVWDSLYHTIDKAVYDESARWGVYRRDCQPYNSRGQRYTVDSHFMKERNRLLTEYFPYRTEKVLAQLAKNGWYSEALGIESRPSDTVVPNRRIYDTTGRLHGMTDERGNLPENLAPGLYIINNKVVKK